VSGLLAGTGAVAVPLVLLGSLAGHARRPGLLAVALRAQRTLPAALVRPVAALVLAAEAVLGLSAAAGLLLGQDALLRGALGGAAALLAVYAAYGLFLARTRPAVPCGCTGDLDSPTTVWVAARAAALALLASAGAFRGFGGMDGAETAITVTAGLAFAVLLWTLPQAMNEHFEGRTAA
jgi:hypothetical protein